MKSRSSLRLPPPCSTLGFLSAPAMSDSLPDPATKDKVPSIAYVQAMIWKRLDLADFTLTGVVKSGNNKKQYPIKLLTKGHELVYEFQDQPLQIRVQLNPGSFSVQKRSSSSAPWADVTAAEM